MTCYLLMCALRLLIVGLLSPTSTLGPCIKTYKQRAYITNIYIHVYVLRAVRHVGLYIGSCRGVAIHTSRCIHIYIYICTYIHMREF